MKLTAEDLLAGGTCTRDVEIPRALLDGTAPDGDAPASSVTVRALTVRDLQQIGRAGNDDDSLSAALMIQHALVEPPMQLEQIARLPAGIARFLVERINEISGVDTPSDQLAELVQAPLAKACFVLAREFGWTPEEVSGMTVGQILLFLEMSRGNGSDG
jgi:hypothetical protein